MSTKKQPHKPKVGRPPYEFPYPEFEEMCRIHCTEEEITNILNITVTTLNKYLKERYNDTFYNVYKRFQHEGNESLRRNQVKQSETNPTMAIWLGKQNLNQKDIQHHEIVSKAKDERDAEIIEVLKDVVKDSDNLAAIGRALNERLK